MYLNILSYLNFYFFLFKWRTWRCTTSAYRYNFPLGHALSSFPFWLFYIQCTFRLQTLFYYGYHPVEQFVYFHSRVIVVILCGSEDLEHSGQHPNVPAAHFLCKSSHVVSCHWPCPLQSVSPSALWLVFHTAEHTVGKLAWIDRYLVLPFSLC